MSFCDALAWWRLQVFGFEDLRQPYTEVKLAQLITYLKGTKLESLEMHGSYHEYERANGLLSESGSEAGAE